MNRIENRKRTLNLLGNVDSEGHEFRLEAESTSIATVPSQRARILSTTLSLISLRVPQ